MTALSHALETMRRSAGGPLHVNVYDVPRPLTDLTIQVIGPSNNIVEVFEQVQVRLLYWQNRHLVLDLNFWKCKDFQRELFYSFWRQYVPLFASIAAIVSLLLTSDRKSSRCFYLKLFFCSFLFLAELLAQLWLRSRCRCYYGTSF